MQTKNVNPATPERKQRITEQKQARKKGQQHANTSKKTMGFCVLYFHAVLLQVFVSMHFLHSHLFVLNLPLYIYIYLFNSIRCFIWADIRLKSNQSQNYIDDNFIKGSLVEKLPIYE